MDNEITFEELAEREDIVGNDVYVFGGVLPLRGRVTKVAYSHAIDTLVVSSEWVLRETAEGWVESNEPNKILLRVLQFSTPVVEPDSQRITLHTMEGEVTFYTTPSNNIGHNGQLESSGR